jgi:dTDP-4-amino-4,6-dideoxygalactose transaminase
MRAYPQAGPAEGSGLPVTEWASARALSLPLWVGMTDALVTVVADAIRGLRP